MGKSAILFMEDEPVIQEVLAEYMKLQDYEVTTADNGNDAVKLFREQSFDMAVLDIMVPGISGLEVLKIIREEKPQIPVIIMSALGDDYTQVKAFNLYADDYIVKPVSPIILLKRMETILRRVKLIQKAENQFDQEMNKQPMSNEPSSRLVLHEEAYQVTYDGKALPLTISEFLLLQVLKGEAHRAFNREQLILRIFNEDYIGNDRIIDAHVKNLRKKLPHPYIKTIIGIGYQYHTNAENEG